MRKAVYRALLQQDLQVPAGGPAGGQLVRRGLQGTARKGVRYEVIRAIVSEHSLYLLHGLR